MMKMKSNVEKKEKLIVNPLTRLLGLALLRLLLKAASPSFLGHH